MFDTDMRCGTCDRRMCTCTDHNLDGSGDCSCASRPAGLGLVTWGVVTGHASALAIGLAALEAGV